VIQIKKIMVMYL